MITSFPFCPLAPVIPLDPSVPGVALLPYREMISVVVCI